MTVFILAGIIFGTLVSYLASPENFLGGFHTAHAISSNQQTHLVTVFKQNFNWIWQLGILAVFATILMFKHIKTIKNPFPMMVLYIYGLSLGGGFLLVPWLGDGFPRYYIPSYFILIFVTALLLRKIILRPSYFFTCIAIFFLGALVNFFSLYQAKKLNLSITSSPGYPLTNKKRLYLDNYKKFELDHKLAITGVAYGYYFSHADFVANSLGEQGVNNFLLTHSAKK
jgi:MFS family permease